MATTTRYLRPIVGSRAAGVPKIRFPAELRLVDALPRTLERAKELAPNPRHRIQLAWFAVTVLRAAMLIAGAVFVLAGAVALGLSGGQPFGMHPAVAILAGAGALTGALVWSILLDEPFARMPIATSTDDVATRFFS